MYCKWFWNSDTGVDANFKAFYKFKLDEYHLKNISNPDEGTILETNNKSNIDC